MAVRRFSKHVADQNWFAVLVDLGVVTIGVFIGIQASNWNAARLARAEAQAYRTQIVEDLAANEAELAERIAYYRRVRQHALAAMAAQASGGRRSETFLIDAYQATQVSPIRMERSAYDEMLAGGMAKQFAEPTVRRRLSSYYAGTKRLEEASIFSTGFRDRVRQVMNFDVQRRLRERCSDVVAVSRTGEETVTLPERCELDLPPALLGAAEAKLRASPDFEDELARHIADLDVKIARFERWLQVARDTRRSLDQTRVV